MVARTVRIALGVTFGLALVAGLVAYAGLSAVVEAVVRAEVEFVLLAVAAYGAFFVLRGARWRALLRPADVDAAVPAAAALTAFGWLVSTYVPFKAGDAARTAMMARRHDAGVALVGGTVVVERALDMMGLALLASGGLLYLGIAAPEGVPGWLVPAFLAASLVPLAGLAFLLWLAHRTDHEGDANWFLRTAHAFLLGVRSLAQHSRTIPGVAVLTVLVVVSQALVYAFLLRALVPAVPPAALLAVPLFLLSFLVAVTPGHLGTYEAAFVAVFSLFGLEPSALVGVAVVTHVLTAAMATSLGGIGYGYHFATASDDRPPPKAAAEDPS